MQESRFRESGTVDPVDQRSHIFASSLSEYESKSLPARDQPHQIWVVTETYRPEINGVALTLTRLVRGLRARGHTVTVVRPRQPVERAIDRLVGDDHETVLVRGLPLPGYHGVQFGLPEGRTLRRSWQRRRPTVVYVATEGPLGWSAVRAARRLGIPVVSGFHTNFHQYCRHYGIGWLERLALRGLRRFHNRTACTVVSTEPLRAQLQAAGFRHVSVLKRGVDSSLFTPERRSTELRKEWGVSDQNPVLLYVGRVAAEKNLGLAIEAFHAMGRTYGGGLKFVIVGDGPLRQRLQEEHRDVIFAGMQADERLATYYASADVFLFPSETETFGNVTLEAMASGLVVVAYDYACAKLHITDGETGILVRLGDSRGFVDAARTLLSEPDRIERIGGQARQHVLELSWPRVVERFEALLMSARGERRREAPSPLAGSGLAIQSE
jgi:glycosyltransferase involved in cell wall biosynthesis